MHLPIIHRRKVILVLGSGMVSVISVMVTMIMTVIRQHWCSWLAYVHKTSLIQLFACQPCLHQPTLPNLNQPYPTLSKQPSKLCNYARWWEARPWALIGRARATGSGWWMWRWMCVLMVDCCCGWLDSWWLMVVDGCGGCWYCSVFSKLMLLFLLSFWFWLVVVLALGWSFCEVKPAFVDAGFLKFCCYYKLVYQTPYLWWLTDGVSDSKLAA